MDKPLFIHWKYSNILSDNIFVASPLTAQPKSLKGDNLDALRQVVVSVLAWHLCMDSFHVAHYVSFSPSPILLIAVETLKFLGGPVSFLVKFQSAQPRIALSTDVTVV